MPSICRIILIAALVILGASPSYGAGFAMYEYSARGNALGGGLVGRADDPSANAYNPAGITQIPGSGFMVGFTAINPEASVEMNGVTEEAESKFWTPPHLYATQQLNDTFWLGFGVYSRFGLGIEYDDDWAGRYNVYEASIQSVSLNPNLAVKLTDWLSIAAGPEIMWLDFSQKKKVDPTGGLATSVTRDVDAKLEGDSWGYGAVAGIHVTPMDSLKLGLTYRSQVKQTVKGKADFTHSAFSATNPATRDYFQDMDAEGTITLPDSYTFGVAFYPTDKLSLEFDAVYTRWSSYDELKIEFADEFAPGRDSTASKKDWKDVWRYQVSAEYAALDWLDLRASYVYDQTPDPDGHADFMVPANDRHLLGVGAGFHVTENLDVDLGYTYLHIVERDIDARPADGIPHDATFKDGYAHMYALTVGYRF